VVLGKLESGPIWKGQQLVMTPDKHSVEVLGVLSDDVETGLCSSRWKLTTRLKGTRSHSLWS
jgi:peptide chain release factor subunit 3